MEKKLPFLVDLDCVKLKEFKELNINGRNVVRKLLIHIREDIDKQINDLKFSKKSKKDNIHSNLIA